MRQVGIGTSGLRAGALGFGCWRFLGHELSHAENLVETALDLGMTLIDTADIYGFGGDGFGAREWYWRPRAGLFPPRPTIRVVNT